MTVTARATGPSTGDPGHAVPGLSDGFRKAFRHHPSGVAVITADGPAGPVGLTASSVASVSIEPAALVFSLASGSGSAGVVAAAGTFIVHLLSADNVDLARIFARPGAERFTEATPWRRLPGGEPLLAGVRAALLCRPLARTPVGGSIIIAAEVLEILDGPDRPAADGPDRQGPDGAGSGSDDAGVPAGDPLVYFSRTFHRLGPDTALA